MTPWQSGLVVADKYRLDRKIGAGAMGQVWAAVNERTGREVALKRLLLPDEEMRIRLAREARAYGQIRQKNVIEILDFVETSAGEPVLVMPLLRGETLDKKLKREGRLGVSDASRIGRDIARALAAAHAHQIVHRDLKPANVFLEVDEDSGEEVVRVLDFGVAKNLGHSDGHSTVAGGRVGSPFYMSPEQVAAKPVDHRSDLWALGIVLFEMLTGERPFRGLVNEVMAQVLMGDIPALGTRVPGVDMGLDVLVRQCLTRDIQQRLQSAAEAAARLEVYAQLNDEDGRSTLPVVDPDGQPTTDVMPTAAAAAPRAAQPPAPARPLDNDNAAGDERTVRVGSAHLLGFKKALPELTVKGTHMLSPAERQAAVSAAAQKAQERLREAEHKGRAAPRPPWLRADKPPEPPAEPPTSPFAFSAGAPPSHTADARSPASDARSVGGPPKVLRTTLPLPSDPRRAPTGNFSPVTPDLGPSVPLPTQALRAPTGNFAPIPPHAPALESGRYGAYQPPAPALESGRYGAYQPAPTAHESGRFAAFSTANPASSTAPLVRRDPPLPFAATSHAAPLTAEPVDRPQNPKWLIASAALLFVSLCASVGLLLAYSQQGPAPTVAASPVPPAASSAVVRPCPTAPKAESECVPCAPDKHPTCVSFARNRPKP